MEKLYIKETSIQLVPREKLIVTFIENYPGSKSGDIAVKLGIPRQTVIKVLNNLVEKNIIEKHGTGP